MCKRYLSLIDIIKKKLFSSSFSTQKDKTHEIYIPYESFKLEVQNLHSLLYIYIYIYILEHRSLKDYCIFFLKKYLFKHLRVFKFFKYNFFASTNHQLS